MSEGIVLGGVRVPVPGAEVVTWLDDPATAVQQRNVTRREERIRAIVLHTVEGMMGPVLPGLAPEKAQPRAWTSSMNRNTRASYDFLVSRDGRIYQVNDPLLWYTWQARDGDAPGEVSRTTLGIEMEQDAHTGETNAGQYDSEVALVDALTGALGIQRQIPWHAGDGDRRVLARLVAGGEDVAGVYGHRNQTDNRGRGDPGDEIYRRLADAGYLTFDFSAGADLAFWRQKQAELGLTADGVPGLTTTEALRRAGYPNGQLVRRPFDGGWGLGWGAGLAALAAGVGLAWWLGGRR